MLQLADLWPKGCMDNHGIKRAICRAKDRRRALCRRKVLVIEKANYCPSVFFKLLGLNPTVFSMLYIGGGRICGFDGLGNKSSW